MQFEIRTYFASQLPGLGLGVFVMGGCNQNRNIFVISQQFMKGKKKNVSTVFRERKWTWKVNPYHTAASITFVLSKGSQCLDMAKYSF